MSHFIYTDLISSLLDPRLVDPGSTLIYVGAYVSMQLTRYSKQFGKGMQPGFFYGSRWTGLETGHFCDLVLIKHFRIRNFDEITEMTS